MKFGINPDMENVLKEQENVEVNSETKNTEDTNAEEQHAEGNTEDVDKDKGSEANSGTDENQEGNADNNNTDLDKTIEVEPSEAQIIKFLNDKGGKFEKLEDVLKENQAPENPYSSIIEDPEVKSFLDFKKDTGRGLADYIKTQENIDDVPLKDLAIAKAKLELGNLSIEDLTAYIEEETGVDLDSSDDLTDLEVAKIKKFTKDYKANFLAEQEKYKTPLAKEENNTQGIEMITLENGEKVDKKIYEEHQKAHQSYIQDMKVAVDSVAKTSLSVEFDNAGKKEVLTFDYEHDADDKKGMVSLSADLDETVKNLFRTEKGFNHADFAKAVWRLDPKNWGKEVSAIVNKAIADTTLKLQQNENNIDFNRSRIPGNTDATKKKDIFQESSGFGIKFNM